MEVPRARASGRGTASLGSGYASLDGTRTGIQAAGGAKAADQLTLNRRRAWATR